MATIKEFEDLDIWKEARTFCQEIFEIREQSALKTDFRLYDQINGSAGSIMDNIAEGFERNGNKEFNQYLSIAKASCGEARSQLYRIYDRNYITDEKFNLLKEKTQVLSKRIASFMIYLQKTDIKGKKYLNR